MCVYLRSDLEYFGFFVENVYLRSDLKYLEIKLQNNCLYLTYMRCTKQPELNAIFVWFDLNNICYLTVDGALTGRLEKRITDP